MKYVVGVVLWETGKSVGFLSLDKFLMAVNMDRYGDISHLQGANIDF